MSKPKPLPPRKKSTGRVPRSSVWKSGKRPADTTPKEKKAEEIVEETTEEIEIEEQLSGNPASLFGDKPINQLHKMLFFDNKLGKEYADKMFGNSFSSYNKIARPETITIEELTHLAGFLGKNPVWLFCRILSDYTNILAQSTESPDRAASRFKRAYMLLNMSNHFRQSEGLHQDSQKALSLLSELLPTYRDGASPDSQAE